jgi:heptosyltransferase-2
MPTTSIQHPLIVMPSWLGDAVMATPALRLVRQSVPNATITALLRPGLDQLMAGTTLFDRVHVARATGPLGPARVASLLRKNRHDAALLLPNSFATALTVWLARIPRRVGYARDGRGPLLTRKLHAPKRPDGSWAPIPAVDYYLDAAHAFLETASITPPQDSRLKTQDSPLLELATTGEQERAAGELLHHGGVEPGTPMAILNPGGNNPAKRWPPDRFARLANHLASEHGLTVLINGSPAEAGLVDHIADLAESPVVRLPRLGVTIGSLKAVVRRCRIMVTNDTGPRHVAAAFGVPLVSLFGPTDHRWTTIPAAAESVLVADPSLPERELANDHPQRCAIDRITYDRVRETVDQILTSSND